MYLQACEPNNVTTVICPLRSLNLPPEFTNSNNTQRDGLAAASVTNTYGNATANVYVGFVLDGFTKYVNTSKTLPNVNFKLVTIEVIFDHCANEGRTIELHGDGKAISIEVCVIILFE